MKIKTQPSKDYHDSYSNHKSKPHCSSRVKKGASCWGLIPCPSVRKISYRAKVKTKITKMQKQNANSDIQR